MATAVTGPPKLMTRQDGKDLVRGGCREADGNIMGAAGVICHNHLWCSSYVWAVWQDGKTETFSQQVQHPSSARFSQKIYMKVKIQQVRLAQHKTNTALEHPQGSTLVAAASCFAAVFPSAGTGAWSQDGGNYERFFTKKKIKVLERPSRSPDLNPIGKSVEWSEESLCTGDALDIGQIWSAFYTELKVPFSA